MEAAQPTTLHERLPCGIEFGAMHLPGRRIQSLQIRVLAGICNEPKDKLGIARLITETIDKGTENYSGQELFDAFDAIGARTGGSTGRETTTCTCTVLPENMDRAIELHAEFLRRPTFPQDVLDVTIDLTRQELKAIHDDPQAIVDRELGRRAYGDPLGRHSLGTEETLSAITRDDILNHCRQMLGCGRMLVATAGPLEPRAVADMLEKHFAGFGSAEEAGHAPFPVQFTPGTYHLPKDLEQQQIGLCWPGVSATHDDLPVQAVTIGVLSGGMSGRLFTEVREKRGLVYWVGAWQETPRGTGMMLMGASTTPQRSDQTYETLLAEVDRLSEDLEEEELERAKTGILASRETRGDSTRARCAELASDLFFFRRPRSVDEKIERVRRVTMGDVKRYLNEHPRDSLCVVTHGPRELASQSAENVGAAS